MLWRPWRDRKRAARIILEELTLNRVELTSAAAQVDLASAGHDQPTVGYSFSKVGLQSVGLALSELPSGVARDVIAAYTWLDHLTEIFAYYQAAAAEHRSLPEGGHGRALELLTKMRSAGDRFRAGIGPAVDWCEKAMDGLRATARDRRSKPRLPERPRLP